MKIVTSQIVFVYDENNSIRRRIFDFEDILGSLFSVPFNQIAIPDDVFPELPRIEAISKKKFSKLAISQNRGTLITNYSPEFGGDIEQIRTYLNHRIPLFKKAISHENIQYCGVIIEMHFPINEDINSYINKHAGLSLSTEKMRDFILYYSLPYKDEMFINIKITKSKLEELVIDSKTKELSRSGKIVEGLNIIVDMNSKLSFINGQSKNIDAVDDLEQEIFSVVKNNKCSNYLKGEIYHGEH